VLCGCILPSALCTEHQVDQRKIYAMDSLESPL